MTPADCVVTTFGGVRAAARVAGCNPSTVCRWMKGKSQGGTGGQVPQEHWGALLAAAEASGKWLTTEHLRVGRPGVERRIVRRL